MKASSQPTGFYACMSLAGEFHNVVLPADHPSLADGVPSSSQWFATKDEADEFLETALYDGPVG